MMSVGIISTETIKPSSPTPAHLRHFNLSMLDAFVPPIHIPLLLFFPSNSHDKNQLSTTVAAKTFQLKLSLSETLTRYYPLAGRIKEEKTSVDCSDQGADFVEAQVSIQLSEFLRLPDMEQLLPEFLPSYGFGTKPGGEAVPLAVRVNHFQCGGIAIAVSMSHLLGDMTSMVAFLNHWAAIARKDDKVLGPTLDAAALFPEASPLTAMEKPDLLPMAENISSKRFVLSQSKIASLRAKCSRYCAWGTPTRVEALSALLWRCFLRSRRKEGCSSRVLAAIHAINIRPRMDLRQGDNLFGNLILLMATAGVLEADYNEGCLEEQVRNTFRRVDADYIRQLRGPDGHLKLWESQKALAQRFPGQAIESCVFTSWWGLPIYEVNFGWGKPIWVTSAPAPIKNVFTFMDTKGGDGVEVWVHIDKGELARLQQDDELLSYVSEPSFTNYFHLHQETLQASKI